MYVYCFLDSNQSDNWSVSSDVISVTHKVMRKIYPSRSGTQFRPSATPYVTYVPVKECRSICRMVFCIAPELQLFQYDATRKQVPHTARGKMTSSSLPGRWLPLRYRKHGYCVVPFAFLPFRMPLLSQRTRAFWHGMCAPKVLFIYFVWIHF